MDILILKCLPQVRDPEIPAEEDSLCAQEPLPQPRLEGFDLESWPTDN